MTTQTKTIIGAGIAFFLAWYFFLRGEPKSELDTLLDQARDNLDRAKS